MIRGGQPAFDTPEGHNRQSGQQNKYCEPGWPIQPAEVTKMFHQHLPMQLEVRNRISERKKPCYRGII